MYVGLRCNRVDSNVGLSCIRVNIAVFGNVVEIAVDSNVVEIATILKNQSLLLKWFNFLNNQSLLGIPYRHSDPSLRGKACKGISSTICKLQKGSQNQMKA